MAQQLNNNSSKKGDVQNVGAPSKETTDLHSERAKNKEEIQAVGNWDHQLLVHDFEDGLWVAGPPLKNVF